MDVSPGQFICGHTPMREMVQKYRTVLVVGGEGEKCREVAEGYGFKDVVTLGDIIMDNNETTPFRKLTEEECNGSQVMNFAKVEIEAILVFADNRDWALDQQIILDWEPVRIHFRTARPFSLLIMMLFGVLGTSLPVSAWGLFGSRWRLCIQLSPAETSLRSHSVNRKSRLSSLLRDFFDNGVKIRTVLTHPLIPYILSVRYLSMI
jgi:hypothetical protein